MSSTWISYGGLFEGHTRIDEHYSNLKANVANEIENIHDRICEEQEEEYTVRQLMKLHVKREQPSLNWSDMSEIASESVDNAVLVGYSVPISSDKHEAIGLYYSLPDGLNDERSEFVYLGVSSAGPQPMLIIRFRIPRTLWDKKGLAWFQTIRDHDLRWLKRVVAVYCEKELEYNDAVAELIHQRVRKRYKFVRDLPLKLGGMPLPSDITEAQGNPTKNLQDPSYRVHKRFLFGQQEGICKGCSEEFGFKSMTVDHIVPRSKGGSDEFDNLQLLCSDCGGLKADGTMEDLRDALAERRS